MKKGKERSKAKTRAMLFGILLAAVKGIAKRDGLVINTGR